MNDEFFISFIVHHSTFIISDLSVAKFSFCYTLKKLLSFKPMKLAFIDKMNWDYDAETPCQRPLGGSQSALCYLTVALAARGHSVVLYTGTASPRVYQGVQCGSYQTLTREALTNCDAVIVSNGPAEICFALRP